MLATHARISKHSEVWLEECPSWTHSILIQEMPHSNVSSPIYV